MSLEGMDKDIHIQSHATTNWLVYQTKMSTFQGSVHKSTAISMLTLCFKTTSETFQMR